MEELDIGTNFDIHGEMTETPMSRTHQYRKVMKPLLERKRRARINKCLDELKDLMVHALQHEGENITKLEKADVLELTVRHLRKLKRQQMLALNPGLDLDRFHAGYTACATEVNRCMSNISGVDGAMNNRLMSHLGQRLISYEAVSQIHPGAPQPNLITSHQVPLTVVPPQPNLSNSKLSPYTDSDHGYNSGRDSSPSPTQDIKRETEPVWRPF